MAKLKKEYQSSLNLMHDLVGGKWKMRILWHIASGENRFSRLERVMPDITQKVLASQLKELEKTGMIKKEIVNDFPPKTILYHINPANKEIHGILEQSHQFTRAYAKRNKISLGE